jgi:hypothetical protein
MDISVRAGSMHTSQQVRYRGRHRLNRFCFFRTSRIEGTVSTNETRSLAQRARGARPVRWSACQSVLEAIGPGNGLFDEEQLARDRTRLRVDRKSPYRTCGRRGSRRVE